MLEIHPLLIPDMGLSRLFLPINLSIAIGLILVFSVRPQVPDTTEVTDLKVLTQYPYGVILEASLTIAGDPKDVLWLNPVVRHQGETIGKVTGSSNALPRGTHTIRFPARIGICNPTEFDTDEIGVQFSRNREREPYIKMIPFKKHWSNMTSPRLITTCSPPPSLPAPPPTLSSISPVPVAAGHGQMVTVYGKHLIPTGLTRVTLKSEDDPSQSPFRCSFVYQGASTPQSLYVRLVAGYKENPSLDCPNGLHPSPGIYTLIVSTPTGISNPLPIEISTKPATPVIRYMKLDRKRGVVKEGGDFKAKIGEKIIVVAYGIDTTGLKARFEQGTKKVSVRSRSGVSSPLWGLGAGYTIPDSLLPGEAQVRVQTRVKRESSEWSKPHIFQIIP